jgi:hypothetical protein
MLFVDGHTVWVGRNYTATKHGFHASALFLPQHAGTSHALLAVSAFACVVCDRPTFEPPRAVVGSCRELFHPWLDISRSLKSH